MDIGDELSLALRDSSWYHTIELPGGRVTPGFFDHRSVLRHYPFPSEMSGMRALDVGSADGFFSFQMERRGAAVVAIDAPDRESLDFPAPLKREEAGRRFQPVVRHFPLVRDALQSSVDHRLISAYDISPESLGHFDFVFVGSVLVHLRDPVGVLMKLRSVCTGQLLMVEAIDQKLERRHSAPLARFQAISPHLTWWIPNTAAWEDMAKAAGFVQVERLGTFVLPYGRGVKGGVLHSTLQAVPG
jgi:tRNA (mo5U34)-methyltransferase